MSKSLLIAVTATVILAGCSGVYEAVGCGAAESALLEEIKALKTQIAVLEEKNLRQEKLIKDHSERMKNFYSMYGMDTH